MTYLRQCIQGLVTLILIVAVLSGCGGAETRKAKYLEKAKEYIEQENYKKAAIELRNVLQIDPKHSEAYYLIGAIEEKDQNWAKAYGNYAKALDLDPSYAEARLKLGYFSLMSNDNEKAKEHVD
ncbi:MAG: hypothetical protein OEZ01_00375, partial [Candidatus Heimdallarchaeota archaeon]|nr:hypothetical protein [Candidatus Heimdallarchaeota archaeon]